MPKKASVLKRDRQNAKRRERNRNVKSNMRTAIKKLTAAIEERDAEKASQQLKKVVPTIDKAASKGVIHKNTASRYVSRLTRKVDAITSSQ
jgi:small subunit ribosomal protein S20